MMKRFVDMLVDYGIMEQIFPVITKQKTIKPTSYLTVAIAQVLRDNEPNEDFKSILVDAKIPGDFVDFISILIRIYREGITPDNVYRLYKDVHGKNLRYDILEEWFKVMGFNTKEYKKFLEYRPSTPGREVTMDGFKGPGIGREIARREGEKFQNLVKESFVKSFDDYKKNI